MDPSSGQLTVGSNAGLDYEMQSVYTLKVTATVTLNGGGTLTDTVKVTITVENVHEEPMFADVILSEPTEWRRAWESALSVSQW